MKRMIMFLALAVILTACAGYQFKTDSKIGVGGTDKAGNSYFCAYDQEVEKGKFDFEATCSMTVKTEKGIFECEKISLEKIGKDFEIETDCKLILAIPKEKT